LGQFMSCLRVECAQDGRESLREPRAVVGNVLSGG
jgi:hypothetical protein